MLKNRVPLDKAIDEANALEPMAYVITEITNSFESAEKWDKEADKFSARAINNQRDADDRKKQAGECRIEAGKALFRAQTMLQDSGSNLSWAQFCKQHIPRSDRDIRRVMKLAGADDPEAAAEAARAKNAEDQRRSRANRRTDNAPVSPLDPKPDVWAEEADRVVAPPSDAQESGSVWLEARKAARGGEQAALAMPPAPRCAAPPVGEEPPAAADIPAAAPAPVAPAPSEATATKARVLIDPKTSERARALLTELPPAELLEWIIDGLNLRNVEIVMAVSKAQRIESSLTIISALGVSLAWLKEPD